MSSPPFRAKRQRSDCTPASSSSSASTSTSDSAPSTSSPSTPSDPSFSLNRAFCSPNDSTLLVCDECFDDTLASLGGSTKRPKPIEDVDTEEFQFLLKRESLQAKPSGNYFSAIQGGGITPQHRLEAVQFLMEVCEEFCNDQPENEVISLAVNYFDRFLSATPMALHSLKLLVLACISVAYKYRARETRLNSELLAISNCHFKHSHLYRMELLLLQALGWELNQVTPYTVLHTLQSLHNYDATTIEHTSLFLDLSFLDPRCIGMPPSVIVAASLLCVGTVIGRQSFPSTLLSVNHALVEKCVVYLMSQYATQFPHKQRSENSSPTTTQELLASLEAQEAQFTPIT